MNAHGWMLRDEWMNGSCGEEFGMADEAWGMRHGEIGEESGRVGQGEEGMI